MAAAPGVGAQPALAPGDAAHRAIYRELVEIDSSPAGGREPQAAAAVGERLRRAGFPAAAVVVDGAVPECQNVVATLAGRNRETPPLLMLAHLDVVNARREDWTHDPFVLREADGYFFGRGTLDNKAGASVLVANMVQWQRDAFVPARDVVMVPTRVETMRRRHRDHTRHHTSAHDRADQPASRLHCPPLNGRRPCRRDRGGSSGSSSEGTARPRPLACRKATARLAFSDILRAVTVSGAIQGCAHPGTATP